MSEEHVGYLDFEGMIASFNSAKCCFARGELDVKAEGAKCKLHLYGVPFPEAATIADVSGGKFGPDSDRVHDDPMAEGGIETKSMWLSFQSMEVKCRSYDPAAGLITVWFHADVQDSESGRSGAVDCSVRCTVVEKLW